MSHSLKHHPKELWILALTELCERYAFWGVGNLLVLYLIESYQFSNVKATHIYGIFTGCAAFLPLVGGYFADRWRYQTPMLLGALFNALGCFLLATGHPSLLFVALTIIALGYGIFTPSILTILGYSYRATPHLREAGFSIYYAAINVGVFLALLSMGMIGKWIGWSAAFIVAGGVQLIGLCPLFFYLSKHSENLRGLQAERQAPSHPHEPLTRAEKGRLGVIAIFCLFSILFWIAYNQAFSSMEIFAHSFMNKTVLGVFIPEGVFLSTESLFLVFLAPLLAFLYARLQKVRKDPSPAKKTALSLLFLAACFLTMMAAVRALPSGATEGNISWTYLVSAYFLMAVGEMLLAPIGLSMVSHLAPKRFTALLIGVWYVCVGLAFYIGGMLAGLMESVSSLFVFFSLFVAITGIPGLILFAIAKRVTALGRG
jgi:POT family proton-dependent oligopeptide transporter